MSDQPHPSLRDLVLGRLAVSGLDSAARDLVAELLPEPRARSAGRAGPVYLRSISAAGWRGIGPATTLELTPGPGLTVVAGRNGSGKSSFAEAAEMVLTGDNFRWQDRTQVWKQGWRNLHDHSAPQVSVRLCLDGESDPLTVHRSWHGDGLDDSRTVVHRPGGPEQDPREVIDAEDLALYRPFLSYSELGAMINGRMSALHDALAQILGLDLLGDADNEARARAKKLTDTVTGAGDLVRAVSAELSESDDPRAAEALAALGGRLPDLDRLRGLLKGQVATDGAELARLRRLAALEGPDPREAAAAAARLREAAAVAEDARFTTAEDARQLIGLLERALDHRRRHPRSADCPVCGGESRLDEDWAEHAREQVERLRREAAEAQTARADLAAAVRAVHDLVQPVPGRLQGDASQLTSLWSEWAACRGVADPHELADRTERVVAALAEACRQLSEEAADRIAEQDGRWQPLALRLAECLREAERAEAARPLVKQIKDGRAWLRKVTDELREERLRPFADQSQTIWKLLCERSSVSLGPISLAGTANARKVVLDASVDTIDAPAFGVMSQGELHSLALSLFLPRATHRGSPFGFLVIDDPVQSMDPEKVEGLARVLHLHSQQRQVVVFTHDTRLQQAIHRLRVPATIMQVSRQTDSVVRVTRTDDPVTLALGEARAVAGDRNVPQDVADRVLPQMCRGALEAAYLEPARRRLRADGHGHDDIEARIGRTHKLTELAALAFYDSAMAPAEVLAAIAQDHGPWARTLIERCNAGAHQAPAPSVAPKDLVRETERLARAVQRR
ncbi:AAA family ATPase [Streptomyces sp. NBC_00190]|uniref:AAA family ATPase n=1 Tax=unclassified Streptomyces TaxID=2593676 RepID=UPI002E2803E3|nr:AAA family ATPase [Streptomyces sp. NBC_00190]WSZ42420.1 AAA family ATPase [Streptomyces sp. NBC_00868]